MNTAALLPSSQPFLLPEADTTDLLFTLTVDDGWRPAVRGEEIGQFNCGGNNHGVYRLPDGSYQIVVSDVQDRQCSLLEVTADFRQAKVCLNGTFAMRNFGLNNALMMAYAFAGSQCQTLLMHASVVRKDGYGYLCLGVSGTGKSTHTGLWLKHIPGTDLMNDDNPVVRRCPDGVVRVYGSPWSGKTPCYRNVEAPVGAFLQLQQAPHNKIRRQSVVESFASLLPSCSVMKWDERDYMGTCDTVAAIMQTTPTYLLECLPDEAACQLSYNTIRAV
ncbi:MAG: hypothetical protein IJV06_01820 [Bacteroidaceae bacterium]|nr:hypothetical protein [Bacteroidaceae bacterium]